MTVCSCHVADPFQSESTLYSCLNVKEVLARSRREIWKLSDCNWTRTQNHSVRKRTLKFGQTVECSLTNWAVLGSSPVAVTSQQTFIVFQDVFKMSWRRLQRNTFRLPTRLEDVFKTYLQYVFLKRLQDVFKTCLQDVLQLCLEDVLEDKKMLHWRRLQYVFTKMNVCWVKTIWIVYFQLFLNL